MSLGYTEKEVNDLIIFAGFSINNNMLNQMRKTTECIKSTKETKYPAGHLFTKSSPGKLTRQKTIRSK